MRELVGIKIDVGLNETTGHAEYPEFNKISSATRKGMDWSKYVDVHGSGMHYDKTCGHQEEGSTPYGHQCCCICVPEDFAIEALSLFPGVVTPCSDVEFETFHDTKAHAHEPSEHMDTNTLNALAAQRSLMLSLGQDITALDAKITRALDPQDATEVGVMANPGKTWALSSARQGITIKKGSV